MKIAKLATAESAHETASSPKAVTQQNGSGHMLNPLQKNGVDNGKHIGKLNGKVNILLVDDRKDKLLALNAILTPLGQNLVEAHSGKEALRLLLKNEFAVILMDVSMPTMDGFETAALIRKRPSSEHTPIIFVTSISGIGLFISSLSATQQQAMLGTFIFMMPSVLLSGFATPIENMPSWLQPFTAVIPLKYFLIISKGLFLKAMPGRIVFANIWPLLIIGFINTVGAGLFFRRRLQ